LQRQTLWHKRIQISCVFNPLLFHPVLVLIEYSNSFSVFLAPALARSSRAGCMHLSICDSNSGKEKKLEMIDSTRGQALKAQEDRRRNGWGLYTMIVKTQRERGTAGSERGEKVRREGGAKKTRCGRKEETRGVCCDVCVRVCVRGLVS